MTRTVKVNNVSELLDEELEMSLDELCEACPGPNRWVVELVEEGVIEPVGDASGDWRFTGTSLARAQVALRLRRDLELNTAGIALAIDLMEEIRELRQRLSRLDVYDNRR